MTDKIEILTVKGDKMYKCQKCGETSKRRFNVERHYRRFHEKIRPQKTCCDISFETKSDFYDHKVKIHDEKKKYTKGLQNQKTSEFPKVEERDTKEIFGTLLDIQNNIGNSRLSRELNAPKKTFLNRWQKEFATHKSRRSATKRPSRRVPNSRSMKEGSIKIYNITDESKENMDEALYSIKF